MARAMVLAADGRVLFPQEAQWLEVLLPELAEFPGGADDDQIDALSQGIYYFNKLLKSRNNPHFDQSVKVIAKW
ncbi:MAG: hypothetical protein RIE24_04465 [Silicimonas sp.]